MSGGSGEALQASVRSTGVLDRGAEGTVQSPAPVRVGGAIAEPRRLRYVQPIMPAIAVSARMSGIVFLEITIGKTGRVVDVKVTRSAGVLDQAALDAVRQWEYEPVLVNGVPVEAIMAVTVAFETPSAQNRPLTVGLLTPDRQGGVFSGLRPEPYAAGARIRSFVPNQVRETKTPDGQVVSGFTVYGWRENDTIRVLVLAALPPEGAENKYYDLKAVSGEDTLALVNSFRYREIARYDMAIGEVRTVVEMKALGLQPLIVDLTNER
jgi:TonB family protein